MDLTLVIPAKLEKESLPQVLRELKKYNYKCIIVLEKNDTETIQAINNFDCEILYQKNLGYGSALIEGINATTTKYFCILLMLSKILLSLITSVGSSLLLP